MAKYEVMYIVRPNVDEEGIQAVDKDLQGAFTSLGGKVLEFQDMGLRDLAYEIDHLRKGHYFWYNVEASAEACKEFTRRANINENVIRHIVVRDERVAKPAKAEKAPKSEKVAKNENK